MMNLDNNINHIEVIFDLIEELSSELDLHHEDDDAPGLTETLSRMKPGAQLLIASGRGVPDVYRHILLRFEPTLGSKH
jgi:hypothetical protein